MIAVLMAVETTKDKLTGKYFWKHIDNEAISTVLNTGASRDIVLQEALRHILMTAAKMEFMIKAKHIRGIDNRVPDRISRWHEPASRNKFKQFAKEKVLSS